ncbi:MAG: 16S rRNA (guanine(527)-N(7))-methyltransferase RsmG [Alphaproteobacteria bacterium RIFCSPHIGHO2_12_FULL_63_12]|nr:MAG: 16S rRNA (guanine(527)-N(7))-methyltransferase RsmG [Alphaproteobacteria bacterium RIFCSPHIGHO2_12_FULL_63_12]
MTYGPAEFAAEYDVSRETLRRLTAYDAVLLDWSARHNLIARSTIEDRWDRHYRDSAQLFALIPEKAATLVDLGSGAGFPGLVLAAMGAERGLKVSLVESVGKKAAFLAAAAEAMRLSNLEVIPQRIESITISPPDVVTARALAQIEKLLGYAHEIADEKTVLIFPKGQDVEAELTAAAKSWHISVEKRPSVTSPGSTILVIRNLRPKAAQRPARTRRP